MRSIKIFSSSSLIKPQRCFRTARVGRSGLATSFYNERSSALAPELTKLLKECNQVIPDFLQPYVTEEM